MNTSEPKMIKRARNLYELRKVAGITQVDISQKIQWSQSEVSTLEKKLSRRFTVSDLDEYIRGIESLLMDRKRGIL